MKRSPAITASSCPRFKGDLVGRDAASRPVAGREDRGQVRRHEGARLAPAAADGGPPVAGEHPGGALAGRALLADETGLKACHGHRR